MTHDDVAIQRWLVFGLVLSTTAAATARLIAIFRVDGLTTLEILVLAVFALLFSWIAVSFWIGCLGAHTLWRKRTHAPAPPALPAPMTAGGNSRTVLAVPVFHEDPDHVFARLQAIWESLRETGLQDRFDLFVLSDSSDPACRAAEVEAWRRLRRLEPDIRVFYRNRQPNVGHKSGNIAEFCREWGASYDYMIVLDADSLMTGPTLVSLVQMMDANPRVALIQSPPMLVGGQSLFARSQQFASWVYGRLYSTGFARLQGADGNYWGHNAIIRVRPFMQNCGLPILPGKPPLGGEIMSHDFVEAALLQRAGWEVRMASDLGGSYETTPPTLIDHLKRDRRWCQGNLQHARVLRAKGLHWVSRLHLAAGIMSYLASPIWLLFVISALALGIQYESARQQYFSHAPSLFPLWPRIDPLRALRLFVLTMAVLFGPKVLGWLSVVLSPRRLREHGGLLRATFGFALEVVGRSEIAISVYAVTPSTLSVIVRKNSA